MIAPVSLSRNAVCYARTAGGELLPVIDLTNEAFAVNQTEDELAALSEQFRRQQERLRRHSRWTRRLFFWLFLRKSEFMRSLRASGGTFLDGMSTYRMKLPPALLDAARVPAIDRKLAAAAPFVLMRVRVHDTVRFIVDDLAPRLAAQPLRPLHLVNIAGGPSMDSLNAILLLRKRDPELFRRRSIHIHLFDQDHAGPAFAANALAALTAPGAPLAGVDVALTHVPHRWEDVAALRGQLPRLSTDAVIAASSEGGLFNYADDETVRANLAVLRETLPPDAGIVGTLSPPESFADDSPVEKRIAICLRALEPFRALATGAGWRIERSLERATHTVFLLKM